jgi:hypothetical protein
MVERDMWFRAFKEEVVARARATQKYDGEV